MPWNTQLATMLVAAEAAKYITSSEYESIRSLMQGEVTTKQGVGSILGESIPIKPGYVLSKSSLKELEGVKAELVAVVKRAIEITTQDFTVYDGLRTLKEQQQHVKNGTSQTMKSKHLDGLAVDLVPWIGGKLVWDWDGCYKIAMAMDRAATERRIANHIRWGGAWDRVLSDFGSDDKWEAYKREVEDYVKRQKSQGRSAFLDGPHFEWVD